MNEKDLVKDLPKISHESKIYKTRQQGKQTKLPFAKNQAWRADKKPRLFTHRCMWSYESIILEL